MDSFLEGVRASLSGLGINAEVQRPDDTPLEGALHGWANPADDELTQGDFPFVFDVVDVACHRPLTLPQRHIIQLTAFAHELHDSMAQTLASLRFQVRVLDELLQDVTQTRVWMQMETVCRTKSMT